jgi:hypothetical protein
VSFVSSVVKPTEPQSTQREAPSAQSTVLRFYSTQRAESTIFIDAFPLILCELCEIAFVSSVVKPTEPQSTQREAPSAQSTVLRFYSTQSPQRKSAKGAEGLNELLRSTLQDKMRRSKPKVDLLLFRSGTSEDACASKCFVIVLTNYLMYD